jgi:hypothetical protein
MKRNCLICSLLLLLAVVVKLPAQQSTNSPVAATNSVAGDTIEQTKAKAEKGDAAAQFALGPVNTN